MPMYVHRSIRWLALPNKVKAVPLLRMRMHVYRNL